MGLEPKLPARSTTLKKCECCGGAFGSENFTFTRSPFFPDKRLPICNSCITDYLRAHEFNWKNVDKVCQWADLPFIPKEWERIKQLNSLANAWDSYSKIFQGKEYENLGWDDYFKRFLELKEERLIENELPEINEAKFKKLREKWGFNYDDESLLYLENLYNGLCATQNVASALQVDQALKVCKLSFEIDNRIRAGTDFDKLLSSYDKLVKTADFTPRAVKNASDFDSFGEVAKWMEKRGWRAKFYDDATSDIVDETIKNIQAWGQRLYTDESGIGDEITRRIEALHSAQQLEDNYYIESNYDEDELDKYANEGFDKLFKDEVFEIGNDDE